MNSEFGTRRRDPPFTLPSLAQRCPSTTTSAIARCRPHGLAQQEQARNHLADAVCATRESNFAIGNLSLLKTRKRLASVAFIVPRPYRRRHDHPSVRGRFPPLVPAAQPRLVGTRARCPATPGDCPASATPWPASALLHRPAALGMAIPNLAVGPRRHGAGQTGNRRPVAS